MSDEEEDTVGFGGAEESEEEDTGFGGGAADEEDEDFDEDDDDIGFGADFDEEAAGFAAGADEEEDIDEDGAGWGNADGSDVDSEIMAPVVEASSTSAMVQFESFASKYFEEGSDPKYTIQPIKGPLLQLKAAKEKTQAVDMFKLVCQFMGITAVVGKTNLRAVPAVQAIARYGINEENLREELFCQIMKQMNGNPAAASRARGTILFTLILGTFPCSKVLLPIVDAFIREGPAGYKAYSNLVLRRCIHNGPRYEPPCSLEFEAVKRKQVMKVRVITDLVTREAVTARLDSASVMSEWVQEIAAKIGMKDTYGWSIFVDRFDRLLSLRGAGIKITFTDSVSAASGVQQGLHVMDVISKIDRESTAEKKAGEFLDISGQLSFRKELFAKDHDSMKDPVATHLTFNMIRKGIKDGAYKCASNEDYDKLMASMYYADFGDAMDEAKLVRFLDFWLPDDAKKAKSCKDRAPSVEKFHAKSEYSKRKHTRTQAQDVLIQFALAKWGKVSSFSSDGSKILMPNGLKKDGKHGKQSTRRKSGAK